MGYSPKGRKELDKTEGLSTHKLDVFKVYSLMSFDTCASVKCHHNQDTKHACHPKPFPEAYLYLSFLQSPPCEAVTLSKLYCSPHSKPINR